MIYLPHDAISTPFGTTTFGFWHSLPSAPLELWVSFLLQPPLVDLFSLVRNGNFKHGNDCTFSALWFIICRLWQYIIRCRHCKSSENIVNLKHFVTFSCRTTCRFCLPRCILFAYRSHCIYKKTSYQSSGILNFANVFTLYGVLVDGNRGQIPACIVGAKVC